MNNHLFEIVVNVFVWAYLIYCLYNSHQVKYECQGGSKALVIGIFFGIGLYIYLSDIQGTGLYAFLSLGIAGILFYLVKSGMGENGFYILGHFYKYEKVSNVRIEDLNKKMGICFDYRHRSHYLFFAKDKTFETKKNLEKYYYHEKEYK